MIKRTNSVQEINQLVQMLAELWMKWRYNEINDLYFDKRISFFKNYIQEKMEGWSCCSNVGLEKYYEDRQSTFCLPINPKISQSSI